jgi:redox-sensitive bicupin YhaK (pirin superfamily)
MVQPMPACTGITHSEYNDSQTEPVNFLLIRVLTKQRDIEPHYEQRPFDPVLRQNRLQPVRWPHGRDGSPLVNQDACFSLTSLDTGQAVEYAVRHSGDAVYLFVITVEFGCAEDRWVHGMPGVPGACPGKVCAGPTCC